MPSSCPRSASAQVARTWVDQAGSDANDCQFSTPCLSFSRATQPLIEGGEINAKSDGNFGEFVITQGLTVDGRGHSVSITAFGNGISIDAPGDKVTIRNLHIQGFPGNGDGIDVTRVAHLRIYKSTIRTVTGHGIDFRQALSPSRLTVTKSTITEVGGNGIYVAPGHLGTGAKRVVVRDTELSANEDSGLRVTVPASPTTNPVSVGLFESDVADNDLQGLVLDGAHARARIGGNIITGNLGFGLRVANGAQILSFGRNRIFENGTNGAPNGPAAES